MFVVVVSKMIDGDFKVAEAYYDKGGVKVITKTGESPVTWASTIREVSDGVAESMYKMAQNMRLDSVDELKKILGMDTDKFVTEYQDRFVDL